MFDPNDFIIISSGDVPDHNERPATGRAMQSVESPLTEGDCACPDDGFTLTSSAIPLAFGAIPTAVDLTPTAPRSRPAGPEATTRYVAPDLFFGSLSDSTSLCDSSRGHSGDFSTVFNPLGTGGVVVLNEPARGLLKIFRQPHTLADGVRAAGDPPSGLAHAERMAALGLLTAEDVPLQPTHGQARTLTAWLHVSNACNLRCGYCYVHKTPDSMDEATGRAAVDAVFRSALANGFQAVKLKFAGGEATLNFPLMRTLHDHASKLADRHGLDMHAVVLSNGVILRPSLLTWLRDTGVRLMVSLDGIGADHDAQRVFADGRGSFAAVAQSIEQAVSAGVRPHLSITVTARNAGGLADAVAFALDRDLPFNLNFYRDCAGTPSAAAWRADGDRLIEGMRAAFGEIEARLPRRRVIDALVDRSAFHQPHAHACGAGHSYMVVDHHGRVARCHMEIEQSVSDVLAADPLSDVRDAQTGFRNLPVEAKEGCRDCQWRYWCAGGCSLLTYRLTGRNDIQSPYCDVYKALYPDVVRLEGLRLLKWAGLRSAD